MKLRFAAAFAAALGLAAATATAEQAAIVGTQAGTKNISITGCVVKGQGGYVLTGVAEDTARAALTATPSPTGGQPKDAVGPAQVIYWLDDDDDLEDHAGHRVEVRGEMKGEIEKGEIASEIENGMIELEFKIDGEKVTVKLPSLPVGTSGSIGDKETTAHYVVRRIDVDSVKTIANACQ